MTTPQEILQDKFGYASFREGQENIIHHILQQQDVVGIMPTGAGKSLCYQVPALMMDGITLVISPLISLMKDQVTSLVANGIPGAYFNSSLTWPQYKKALQNAKQGMYKLIYVAPERLLTPIFQDFVQSVKISMVAVDEAHCVSQWGNNFRPSYLQIPEFLQTLSYRPVVAAFTATATGLVKSDIESLLGLNKPFSLTTGFDRPNLYFGVETPKDRMQYVKTYVRKHQDEPGIIYCLTRKQVEEVHEMLVYNGFNAVRYHAGLSDDERRRAQDDFIFDRSMIMVATNAFGMGIDKSNVRYVLHYAMPGSLENYYQEAGRAGRDGEKSECILLYSGRDMHTHEFFLDHPSNPNPDPVIAQEVYRQDFNRLMRMKDYCFSQHCLRSFILEYFGQTVHGSCNNCSVCKTDYMESDITHIARSVCELVCDLPHSYGISFLSDLLKGSQTARVKDSGLNNARGFGSLKSLDKKSITADLESMILSGYLIRSNDQYRTISASQQLIDLVSKNEKITIREKGAQRKERTMSIRLTRPENDTLYRQLVQTRMFLAAREGVPPYIVFSDQTLHAMAAALPLNQEDMLKIPGIGQVKFSRYGKPFLNTISSWISESTRQPDVAAAANLQSDHPEDPADSPAASASLAGSQNESLSDTPSDPS